MKALPEKTKQNITVAILGRALDKAQTETKLVQDLGAIKYRDAYNIPCTDGEAWLFEYGILVCWGINESDRQQLLNRTHDMVLDPTSARFEEQFTFTLDGEQSFKIHNDDLTIPNNNPLTRLAFSHAFAQSSKLVFFEDQAERVISENGFIAKELAKTGKIPLSRNQVARLRGKLFETSSDISLNFNLLDTPEFFWNYPEQEEYYLRLTKYLDLHARIDILNHKLSTIHELLDMLASEQHHKHSAFLEWIIIILIAVDIAIYFFPKGFFF